jgi:hypothetical protein
VHVALDAGDSPLGETDLTDSDVTLGPVALDANRTYTLRVGPAPDDLDADVALSLAPPDVALAAAIGAGPVRVELDKPHQDGVITFRGAAGDRVRATWTWAGDHAFYTSLDLEGPDHGVLAQWSALASGSSAVVPLDRAGTYTINIAIDGDATGSGDVEIDRA